MNKSQINLGSISENQAKKYNAEYVSACLSEFGGSFYKYLYRVKVGQIVLVGRATYKTNVRKVRFKVCKVTSKGVDDTGDLKVRVRDGKAIWRVWNLVPL